MSCWTGAGFHVSTIINHDGVTRTAGVNKELQPVNNGHLPPGHLAKPPDIYPRPLDIYLRPLDI